MLSLREILAAVDAYEEATGSDDTKLSRLATGSTDTIRNWRRALRSGSGTGANTAKLQAVARVIGVDFAIEGRPLLDTEDEIRAALGQISKLTEDNITALMAVIQGFRSANGGLQKQSQNRDLSEPANPHREATP